MANMDPSQSIDPYRNGLTSGSDNPWEPTLGPLSKAYDINPMSKRAHSRWVMPDAYEGRNEYVANTIEDLWVTARYTWMTEYIFPWYKTEEIHLVWTKFELNPAYMSITPHTTSSRTITSQRSIQRASIVRRGIRAEVEDDYIRTEQGRETMIATYMQMARTVQDTANAEGLRQLVNCHRSTQAYNRKYGVISDGDLDLYLERDVERFMIAQKTPKGLETLDVMVNEALENYNDIRDKQMVWILPPDVMNYASVVPPERTYFYLGGQEAVDRVNGRPGTRSASAGTQGVLKNLGVERMISDTPVFVAKGREYMGLGGANLMQRTREVGVYNLMVDRTRDYNDFQTAGLNLRVYDNDIDAWSEITYVEAIKNCGIWTKEGKLQSIDNMPDIQKDTFDWLSRVADREGKRNNISKLGEINPEFITTAQWLAYGKTMWNSMTEAEKAGAVDAQALGTYENGKFTPRGSVTTVRTDFFGITDLLGDQLNQTFLTAVLGAAVKKNAPVEHKTQIQQIAARTDVHWKQRADQIKTYLNTMRVNSPVHLNSTIHEENAFNDWYAGRVQTHESDAIGQESVAAAVPVEESQNKPVSFYDTPMFAKLAAEYNSTHGRGNSTLATQNARRYRIGAQSEGGPGLIGGEGSRYPGARGEKEEERQKIVANDLTAAKGEYAYLALLTNNLKDMNAHYQATAGALTLATVEVTRDNLIQLAERNVCFGWGFALFRPHAAYTTLFAIKCAANGQTGRMVYGHGNMQIGHDVSRKTSALHYTTYLSAVVLDDRNVYVVEDIYCKRYKGGMGVEFWTPEKYKQATNRRSRSIICAPLPPSCKKLERKIDMRGYWYTHQAMGLVSDERFDKPLYPGCARINKLFDLHGGARADRQQTRSRVKINFVCYQGHEWYYNTKTHSWDNYTVEQGHFGPKVYEGCGKVRNGYLQYLEDPGYFGKGKH